MRAASFIAVAAAFVALVSCGELLGIEPVHPLDDGGCEAGSPIDPLNCGQCGHSCLGGACLDGACGVVELMRGEQFPTAIAVEPGTDGFVYWADDVVQGNPNGAIKRIAKDGSPESLEVVYTPKANEYSLTGLALDDTSVYFTAQGVRDSVAGFVLRIHKDGSGLRSIGPFQGPATLAVDQTRVFWVNRTAADRVESANHDLTSPTVLVDAAPYVGDTIGIAVELGANGRLFYTLDGVDRANKDGTNQVRIDGNSLAPTITLAIDDTNVYYFQGSPQSLLAIGKDGTCGASPTCPVVLATDIQSGSGIAIDATTVYWTTFGDGTVKAVGKDGSNLRIIASGLTTPAAVAVDDVAVYFTDQFGGRVLKVAK
jgi:hypothetical protein